MSPTRAPASPSGVLPLRPQHQGPEVLAEVALEKMRNAVSEYSREVGAQLQAQDHRSLELQHLLGECLPHLPAELRARVAPHALLGLRTQGDLAPLAKRCDHPDMPMERRARRAWGRTKGVVIQRNSNGVFEYAIDGFWMGAHVELEALRANHREFGRVHVSGDASKGEPEIWEPAPGGAP